MKKIFTSLKAFLTIAMLTVAGNAMAGSDYYAYYVQVNAAPEGKGTVYANTNGADPEDSDYKNSCELQFTSTSGSVYIFAKPSDGYQFAGVSTATLVGAIAVGAAKGALIGAGIGIGVGSIAGGIGAVASGEELGSSEFWSDVLYGGMLGFGVGSLIGAISGGVYSGVNYGSFSSNSLLNDHFAKHGNEFEGLFSNSTEYAKGAKYTIKNGQYVKEMNGYIRFFGANGKANYAFVGMKSGGRISTFGIRAAAELAKKIPWIII